LVDQVNHHNIHSIAFRSDVLQNAKQSETLVWGITKQVSKITLT